MGTWGTAIFSDDEASDIRDEFRELIGDGLESDAATDQMIGRWQPDSDQLGGTTFWLALAAIQWRLGRLVPRVKQRALEIIDSGQDLVRWEDRVEQRRRVLASLKAQILSEQPPAKRVPRQFRNSNDWTVGSLHAYALRSGKHCIFRVIGHHTDRGGTAPVVELLDWSGDAIPAPRELKRLRIRTSHDSRRWPVTQLMIGATSKREIERGMTRVRHLEISTKPSQRTGGFVVSLWRSLDQQLERIFAIC
jgi:hypothetical protein